MKLINFCEYILKQSLSDTGKYPNLPFITAQDLIDNLNDEGGNK